MFLTNVMNEQVENNKQTNCFLKIFIQKPLSLPLKAKAIHVTLTGSSGFVSTRKKAEHKNYLSQIGRMSQFFLKTLSKIYITSMKHL